MNRGGSPCATRPMLPSRAVVIPRGRSLCHQGSAPLAAQPCDFEQQSPHSSQPQAPSAWAFEAHSQAVQVQASPQQTQVAFATAGTAAATLAFSAQQVGFTQQSQAADPAVTPAASQVQAGHSQASPQQAQAAGAFGLAAAWIAPPVMAARTIRVAAFQNTRRVIGITLPSLI